VDEMQVLSRYDSKWQKLPEWMLLR